MASNLTITLNAPFIFENLVVSTEHFTADEITTLENNNDNLDWADFDNGLILCNYYTNASSSLVNVAQITSFTVQRQKTGQLFWDTILQANIAPEGETPSSEEFAYGQDSYSIIDYNVQNNIEYHYRVFPNISDGQGFAISQIQPTDPQGNSMPFIPNWEIFSLMPITIITNPYNTQKGIAKPVYENGAPMIWTFIGNCEEGAFTKIQDKTYFDTFTQYPKVAFGNSNYFTVNFTGLLGSIDQNSNYYEPTNVWERWNSFINSNYLCLYKNLKGDCRIVSLDTEPTNTYANLYANYYMDNANYVTSKPTTVSFAMTEILDATKYMITEIVPDNTGE